MGNIFDALGSASLWISVVFGGLFGAVVGVLLQQTWSRHSVKLIAFRARRKLAAESRHGRTHALGGALPAPGKVLPDFFRQQEEYVDLAIYELSLRPDIPIMDLLYLEYLRSRIEDGSIGKVVIFPWSGWRDERNHQGEISVKMNIETVFGHHANQVTVVTAEMLQENAESVFDNEFFHQVGHLGNSEFLRNASLLMGYRFRSYHDINQGHPESHQARSIVEHTVRGWLIYKYIEKACIDSSTPLLRIGSLIWETELTKLLLLHNIVANHQNVECSLMLGATITYRHGVRKVSLPAFTDGALTLFGEPNEQLRLLATKSPNELRRTNEILSSILASRRGLRDLPGWAEGVGDENAQNGLHGDALALERSLRRVRRLYNL